MLLIGDFNAKSRNWSNNNATTTEGAPLNDLLTTFRMKQLIKESTHVLENTLCCIGFIFANQPAIVLESGAHSSLHLNVTIRKYIQSLI